MDKEQEKTCIHLGDGAYASFNGYHIVLSVNHHKNEVVFLEPQVVKALFEYCKTYFKNIDK